MNLPSWLKFLHLGYPSANLILTTAGERVLFDTGFASDAARVRAALQGHSLDMIVNTHGHSDHVGSNGWLQQDGGIPIAAADAGETPGLSRWLDQPVPPYHVDRVLRPGDVVAAGPAEWQVLATPGHTPGHLSFHEPESRVLILGDVLQTEDVGWINLPLDGLAAIDAALRTVEELSRLPVKVALPGHGPAIDDWPRAVERARTRYERMRAYPEQAAWHACKRILAFALMMRGGIPLATAHAHLASRPWLQDHARLVFHTSAERLATDLVDELRRSAGAFERQGMLLCRTPHHPPDAAWLEQP